MVNTHLTYFWADLHIASFFASFNASSSDYSKPWNRHHTMLDIRFRFPLGIQLFVNLSSFEYSTGSCGTPWRAEGDDRWAPVLVLGLTPCCIDKILALPEEGNKHSSLDSKPLPTTPSSVDMSNIRQKVVLPYLLYLATGCTLPFSSKTECFPLQDMTQYFLPVSFWQVLN